jgi:hypothetical protein
MTDNQILINIITVLLSAVAIELSSLTLYYNYLQGPKIEVEHFKRQRESENPLTYRHVIIVTNHGNKNGLLRDIVIRTHPEVQAKQSYLRISQGLGYIDTVAPIPVKSKESIVIFLDYEINENIQSYWIETTYDKSSIKGVFAVTDTIWHS